MDTTEAGASNTKHRGTRTALPYEVFMWCVAYGVLAVAIVAGNVMSIRIFTQRRLNRKTRHYFLVNLSVADMMVGVTAIPLYIYLLVASYDVTDTPRDLTSLRLGYTAIDVFFGLGSVFTLNAVALERFYAVNRPMKFRAASERLYLGTVCLIWGLATSLSAIYCLTSLALLPRLVFVYALTASSLSSLLITCVANASIWVLIKLWNNHNSRNSKKAYDRREKHLANALLLITVAFILTWCPFHVLNILGNFQGNIFEDVPTTVIFLGKLLQYSNSLANPVIYSLKIPEFKAALRRSFYGTRVRETRL